MTTYKRRESLVHDATRLFTEIRKIQGNYPIISLTKIIDVAEKNSATYPELSRIITSNPVKSAKYVISMTLRANQYQRWNNASGSTFAAVWREPCQ